jgi:hypothetical protein
MAKITANKHFKVSDRIFFLAAWKNARDLLSAASERENM